jgi:hypothetical protein
MEFLLDAGAYDLLLAHREDLSVLVVSVLSRAVREAGGYRLACEPRTAVEMATWFIEESGRQPRIPDALHDACLRAAGVIVRAVREAQSP